MTSFDEVYKQYFRLTNDIEIKRIYTTDYSYKVLNDYLEYVASIYNQYCYKDLTDTIPFQLQTYTFTADGISNDYILSPIPPANCDFYIKIDDNEINEKEYKFDVNNNKLQFTTIQKNNSEIYIGAYFMGSFNQTLNKTEINLLAEGMAIPFNSNKLNNSLLTNNSVYGADYNPYSPANHIKELRNTIESGNSTWVQKIKNYMWKGYSNFNNLHG